jgi:hybrid cluster-associated redox disulfide protein
MTTHVPTNKMNIAQILERWPQTALMFQRLHTACVGCSMAPFCTVDDLAAYYDLDAAALLLGLHEAARTPTDPDLESV